MEPIADAHATEDSQAIAQKDIENEAVPPALLEVGENVREGNLSDLPVDGKGPQDEVMAQQHGFDHPTEKVAKCKNINVAPDAFNRNLATVDGVLLVQDVRMLHQFKLWVQIEEDFSSVF